MTKREAIEYADQSIRSDKRFDRIPVEKHATHYDCLRSLEKYVNKSDGYDAAETFRRIENICDKNWPVYHRSVLFNRIENISNSSEEYMSLFDQMVESLNESIDQDCPYEHRSERMTNAMNLFMYFLAKAKSALYDTGKRGLFNNLTSKIITVLKSFSVCENDHFKKTLTDAMSPDFTHEKYLETWFSDQAEMPQ